MTRPATHFLATAIIGGLTVLFFIGVRHGEPPWMQEAALLVLGLALAFAFVVGLAFVRSELFPATSFLARVLRVILISSMVCMPVLMLVQLTDSNFQKLTVLIEVGLVYLLLLSNGLGLPNWLANGVGILGLAVGLQTSFSAPARTSLVQLINGESTESADDSAQYVFSPLHDVKVVTSQVVPSTEYRGADQGGALELVDESRLLLVDANGGFYQLTHDQGQVRSAPLGQLRSAMNRTAYERDTEFPSQFFRITDMLLIDDGTSDKRLIYVVHHQWDEGNQCVTLDLDEAEIDLNSLDRALEWNNRFRTTPCIPGTDRITNLTGGRLALRSPNSLLLTVGVTVDAYSEGDSDPGVSYGKILELDRMSWTSRVFSTGHRNPQGLLVDEGAVWSTEQGPNGGDELNLILEGADYGWPTSAYGVDYGKKTLTGSNTPGEHSTGVRPMYAWLPSIGVSRLIRVRGDAFSAWRGDLLVGSLSGGGNGFSLYRVRMHEGAVKTVERISVGQRVRDLVEMENGHILSWDGRNFLQTFAPASHIFSECIACHVLNEGYVLNGIGPDLRGIVGRLTATVDGFAYSEAMQASGGRWSKERLDMFLRDPQEVVPGTTMVFPGIENRAERQAIIEYMERLSSR